MQDEKTTSGVGKTTAISAEKPEKLSKQVQTLWLSYLQKDHVNDFAVVPVYAKLALMQSLPADVIEYRKVGDTQVPYIKHEVAEKALNFAFNFNVDVEVVKDGGTETVVNGKKCFEATMQVKFTFTQPDGSKIVRTVFSGHRLYFNPASTKADAYKAALSKAYTIVARTFGIGTNIKDGKKETKFEQIESEAYEKADEKTGEVKTKSFAPASGGDGMGLGF